MDSKSSDNQNGSKSRSPDPVVNCDTIPLADINAKDTTFRITTRRDIDDLLHTILSLGLLHPPVLIENAAAYRIVSGFRRIAACRHLGWQQIAARIYKASVDHFKIAQLAIADNALQRPLNLVETSRALNLLADMSPNHQQLRKASLSLGLPINPSITPKIQEICGLPLPIQEGILMDTISMSMARELGNLDAADATALVELFNQLKVGLNKQRELHLLLSEIAKREDISIKQLLTEKPLRRIVQNPEMDRALQRQSIRSHLRKRRFPAICRAEADYQKSVRQLKLGNHIKLVPPKDFEGTTYTLILNFKNRHDLGDLKEKIEKILEHPALAKILNP